MRILRFCRRLLVAVVLPATVLAGVLYLAVPPVVQSDWGRAQVAHGLRHALNSDVTIGHARWSWRKGLTLEDVTLVPLADTPAFRITAPKIRFRPKIRKLLSRQPRATLELTNPVLEIREGSSSPLHETGVLSQRLRLEKILVRGGTLVLHDPEVAAPLVLENVEVACRLDLSRKKARLQVLALTATMNGGSVSGHGWLVSNRGRIAGDVAIQGADILHPGEPDRGLLDFDMTASGQGESLRDAWQAASGTGWYALREGTSDADASFRIREGRLLFMQD